MGSIVQVVRGTIVNRTYGTHKNLHTYPFFTTSIWSYLLWPPVIVSAGDMYARIIPWVDTGRVCTEPSCTQHGCVQQHKKLPRYIFTHFHHQYLVLLTMVPRDITCWRCVRAGRYYYTVSRYWPSMCRGLVHTAWVCAAVVCIACVVAFW